MALCLGLKGVNLSSAGKQVKNAFKVCSQSKLNPVFLIPTANYMFGSHLKDPNYKRPPPHPYEEKGYGLWQSYLDSTTWRFDDNTKLIHVEGPPGAGKTDLAKKLAEDFDMKHMEDPTMDRIYINHYGHDFRTMNDRLPVDARSFDETDFCKTPTGWNAAFFQLMKYKLRFSQEIDALTHILNTGQGVVVERSPYTDIAFADAMVKNGFMSKPAFYVYTEVKRHTMAHLMKPHVFIYLDIPVPTVLQRIKERDLPHERNSPALTEKFLTDYETSVKTQLQAMSEHSEILVYDWSEFGDPEVVVEDLEKVDFDRYYSYSQLKFRDWRMNKEKDYDEQRQNYTDWKHVIMASFNVPLFDAPELCRSGNDSEEWIQLYEHEERGYYQVGYNPSKGDKGILWKSKKPKDKDVWFCG